MARSFYKNIHKGLLYSFLSASWLTSASISPFVFFCFLSLSVCQNLQCLSQFVISIAVKLLPTYFELILNNQKFMPFIVMSFWVTWKSCPILSHFLRSSHIFWDIFKSHVTTVIRPSCFSRFQDKRLFRFINTTKLFWSIIIFWTK